MQPCRRVIQTYNPFESSRPLSGGPVPVQTAIDVREYLYRRARYGAAGGLDYRLGGGSSAFVRGLFSQFNNYGTTWFYSPGVGAFITPTTTPRNGSLSYRNYDPQGGQHVLS